MKPPAMHLARVRFGRLIYRTACGAPDSACVTGFRDMVTCKRCLAIIAEMRRKEEREEKKP